MRILECFWNKNGRENENIMTKQRMKILAENEKSEKIKLMEENNAIRNELERVNSSA